MTQMLEGEKSTHEYQLNRNVKVLIKSKRVGEEYYHTVVMTAGHVTKTPLEITEKEDIAHLIEGIDLEEEQTSMNLDGGEEE